MTEAEIRESLRSIEEQIEAIGKLAAAGDLPPAMKKKIRAAQAALGDVADKLRAQLEATHRANTALRNLTSHLDRLLTSIPEPDSVRDDVSPAHRQSISRARGGTDEFVKAFQRAGFPSLRDLAEAIDVDASFLSMVRHGKRKMPPDKAAKIEKLTGYPASRWPT